MVVDGILLSGLFVFTGIFLSHIWLQWALQVIFLFLYTGFLEGTLGATLGKRLLGLEVVEEGTGQALSLSTGFLRAGARLLSLAVVGVGFFRALGDARGRTLHDRIAHTVVVRRRQAPVALGISPTGKPPQRENGQPRIKGISGFFAGQERPIPSGGLVLGRDPGGCSLVFPDETKGISRIHCRVEYDASTRLFTLHDLGSSYGTYRAGGGKIPQGQPDTLSPGEFFYLAAPEALFQVLL